MWEFVVLVLIVSLLYIYNWIKNYRYWKHIMEIPGPRSYPIIGNTLGIILDTENLFYSDRQRNNEFYPIYKLWNFTFSCVCVIGADDIELILNNSKHIQKSRLYKFLYGWLGTGLLTSDGVKWQNRRKILTPSFHFSILQKFVAVFNNETQNLVEALEKECEKPYTDVVKPITQYTLHSLGETSLGVELSKGNTAYKAAIHEFGKILIRRLLTPWYFTDFVYKLSFLAKNEQAQVKILHDFSKGVIADRKQLFSVNGEVAYSKSKRLAMLDLLLKAKYDGADIDDEGIREEVDTFMFEGHDTTSMALCYTLMALANEAEIQEQIRLEIEEVLGEYDMPTYQQLTEMNFMERCIKECLRLYPSVPFIGRIAGEDIKTHTGYTIPKGCDIHIYIYDLHRSTQYWENPEKFDPDRFLPENIAKRHTFAYLPFSAGFRNCIGQRFAMLEIKAALCGILRKFELKPVDTQQNIKHRSDLVLRPFSEVNVKFVARK